MKRKRETKPKLISERILNERSIKPIMRVERTYSHRQKIRILAYLEHQQIALQNEGKFRKPA